MFFFSFTGLYRPTLTLVEYCHSTEESLQLYNAVLRSKYTQQELEITKSQYRTRILAHTRHHNRHLWLRCITISRCDRWHTRTYLFIYPPIYLPTYLLLMHTRSRALAFHICDPTRTNTVKARRCQHVCQRNKRNPSTCEIGRDTPGIETRRRLRRTFYRHNSRTSRLL